MENYYLPKTYHKSLKLIHHIFSISTLGGLICILALLLARDSVVPVTYIRSIDYIIFFILDLIVSYAFLAVIVTGLFISLFSHWGFLKNHWIIMKITISVILLIQVVFWLTPSINSLAAYSGSSNISSSEMTVLKDTAILNSTISGILFFSVILLSVVKPFGKRKNVKTFNRKKQVVFVTAITLIFITLLSYMAFQLNEMRTTEVKKLDFSNFKDGHYKAELVKSENLFEAEFNIRNGEIYNIQFSTSYQNLYTNLAKLISNKLSSKNSIDVEVVSGATTTSKLYLKTIEKALLKGEKK